MALALHANVLPVVGNQRLREGSKVTFNHYIVHALRTGGAALLVAACAANGASAEECVVGSLGASATAEIRSVPQGAALPQIIVKRRENTESLSALALEERVPGLVALTEVGTTGPMLPGVTVFQFDVPAGMDSVEASEAITPTIARLRAQPDVEYAHLNYVVGAHAGRPSDPCYSLQWHYWPHGTDNFQSDGGIDLPAAWSTNTGSANVIVAVIDTGLVAGHPDINGNNVVPGWDFIDNDSDATDIGPNNGFHGTHVAGTIGVLATDNGEGAASANWNVKIQPIRALDGNGSGSFLGIANAIFWAAGGTLSDGNTNPTPAKVINMSLGGGIACLPENAGLIIDAINFATAQGALVVVSAGNSSADAAGFTPASCPNTMTVASTGFSGRRSWFSNHGAAVDIAAPGGEMRDRFGNTIDLNGDGVPDGVLSSVKDGYDLYQGTSMAAPHVSGVAALILARDPTATPQHVTATIINGATPLSCDLPCGAGLLNAAVAQ